MMTLPLYYWASIKRERIHTQAALDVGDNIVELIYGALAEHDMTDTADTVAERVKDNVWCNIPGERSA